jgi:uncharacterized protein YkwD
MPKLISLILAALCACLAAGPAGAAPDRVAPAWATTMSQAKPPSPAACLRGAPAMRQERALRRQIRRMRAARGKVPIRVNRRLTRAARHHSHRLVWRGIFEHSARMPYGRTRAAGQNLARTWNARQALRLMMHSPTHRRTLLDGRWRAIGVGAALDCHGMVTFTVNFATGPARRR